MKNRYEKRVDAEIPIDIIVSSKTAPFSMKTSNISASGAFVKSALSFNEGELIACSFCLPDRISPLSFFAKIVRTERCWCDSSFLGSGFGIKFIDTTIHERHLMRSSLGDNQAVTSSNSEKSWFN